MTNHFEDISYYRNLDPLIQYGDTWLYGAALPNTNVVVPTDVYVLHERHYNIISWKVSVTSGIKGYYVYRSKTIGHTDAKLVAMIFDKDSSGEIYTCYVDYLLDSEIDTQYYYAVMSMNEANYFSLFSNWAADINLDNSFTSPKYLYTDQLTQSYWSIIDLYKTLGNIDTDRNIIPYRDRGNTYVQVQDSGSHPDMYLKGELAVEQGNLNNKGTIVPGYLRSEVGESPLEIKNVPVKVDCNYLYVTPLQDDTTKTYTFYMDDIPIVKNQSSITVTALAYEDDDNNNLSDLTVDKVVFSSKVTDSGTYSFYWNDIYNYWQTETEQVDLNEFGITFKGTPTSHNVISVDYNKVGYVYFRIPYIYNSKVLQTYIKSSDGEVYNKFAFKAYNHLIFASTLGKIFNDIQIQLKELKGNIYITDVSDPYVYSNFASFFNFEQPAWLNNSNYRNCVLGDTENNVSGLWQAAMIGGTQLSINQAVEALSSGNFTMSSLNDIDYLTCYSAYNTSSLVIILPYNSTSTYSVDDIIYYDSDYYKVDTAGTMDTTDFTGLSSDSKVTCVNKDFKDALFMLEYDTTDPINVTVLTDTETVACNKYDLINVDSNFYEVRKQVNYYYVILKFTSIEPNPTGIANGTYYFNTQTNKLYRMTSGSWVEAASDLKTDALYFNSDNHGLYIYNSTTLIEQNILRDVNKICEVLKLTMPAKLYALYKLIGTEYYLVSLQLTNAEKDYIFEKEYTTDSITDPISYRHQYIINTYRIEFDYWKRTIAKEKYLVYGNKLQLNNKNILYTQSNFAIYTDETLTDEVPAAAYTVDAKNGVVIWQDLNYKPEDGSYVYINYNVDIRPDIIKLIELFKFPQVNIEYVWVE